MSQPRVLVVRVGAMGDVLHALPAAAALRRLWPEAVLDWVVDPRWAPLLVGDDGRGPVVSRVHLADTRLWSRAPASLATLRSLLGLRRALRERRYDLVVDMQGTLRSAVLGQLAPGATRVGYADPRESAARWFYTRRETRRGTHVVEQGAVLLGDAVGVTLEPIAPTLPRNPVAEARLQATLTAKVHGQRVALLAPAAGWGAKMWPAERFGALAAALADEGWQVFVNASSAEDPVCAAVLQASGDLGRRVSSSVAELVALVRHAGVVVGGDSGPVHLAAALGTPAVALFGPTDPARNGPWGPGPKQTLRAASSRTSYKRRAAVEPGLARIGVPEVLAAVSRLTASALRE